MSRYYNDINASQTRAICTYHEAFQYQWSRAVSKRVCLVHWESGNAA